MARVMMPTPNRAVRPKARKETRMSRDSMWCFICPSVVVLLCVVKSFLLLIQGISLEVGKGDLCGLAISFCDPLIESLCVLIVHVSILGSSRKECKDYFLFF